MNDDDDDGFRTDEVAYDAYFAKNAREARDEDDEITEPLPMLNLDIPIKAMLRWREDKRVGLTFIDDHSQAWAAIHEQAITDALDNFSRENGDRPILMKGNRATSTPVNKRAVFVGELLGLARRALVEAFPLVTLDIICEVGSA